MLENIWYFGMPSRNLKVGHLVHRQVCGKPIVFGRTESGHPFALIDLCPHRGAPLSEGRIVGEDVVCCYHGWRFSRKGACTEIPSIVKGDAVNLQNISVQSLPVREMQGLIWLWIGEGDGANIPNPIVPRINQGSPQLIHSVEFPVHIDHAVVGLIDPAHTPHVHECWWWRRPQARKNKEKHFIPSRLGFDMVKHSASSNSRIYRLIGGVPDVEIVFALPGIRIEHICVGDKYYCGMTACTPIDENRTLTTHLMWWSMRWLSILKPFAIPFVHSFLGQDKSIFEKQARGLFWNPSLRLVGDPDQQAKWYFRIKNEWRRASAAGKPFRNPLPKTSLRWRT